MQSLKSLDKLLILKKLGSFAISPLKKHSKIKYFFLSISQGKKYNPEGKKHIVFKLSYLYIQ